MVLVNGDPTSIGRATFVAETPVDTFTDPNGSTKTNGVEWEKKK